MGRHLKAFTVAHTRKPEEMRSILANIYDVRVFEAKGDLRFFSAEIAYFNFGSSKLFYWACVGPARIEHHADDYICLQVCLTGVGRVSVGKRSVVINATTIVCSPSEATLDFGPAFEQLVLRASRSALEQDLALILGSRPKSGISFDLAANSDRGQTGRLRNLIIQAASNIDLSNDPIPSAILREMDRTIRLAILYGIPNNYSNLLQYADERTAAPWQVKRIEEWLDANWKQDVTIQDLVDVSGASARSIFATFKRTRGYTPMAYLKKVRLKTARTMLLEAAHGASVTAICFACNFTNPGHFARDYKLEFGELPSQTLQRRKERGP